MYDFYSNNALHSASRSFTMFVFPLTFFDTCDSYYFESNLSVVFFIEKDVTLFCSLLKMNKITFLHYFVLAFGSYFIGPT